VNIRLASFQTGEEFEKDELLTCMDGRVEDIGGGCWWIPKFCVFQYKTLTDKCAPHRKIIETLCKHGLYERAMGLYQPKGKARVTLPMPKARLRSQE
jgi:hypothetical protein